jgi:serine/threonine protein kinase
VVSEQTPWPPRALPAGSRVADYRLDEQIGQGGMAVVYRAYDLPLERQVALKILDPALAQDEEFQQRFIRESRAAAAVDHPNIIPVFGAGQADGVLFIAMRFVAGADVRTLLDRLGPLPAPRVAGIVAQVAAALDSAHHRGLVHRDVKPANILLDAGPAGGPADHVYLSDFGLSKQALASPGLTGAGQLIGTLDYLARSRSPAARWTAGPTCTRWPARPSRCWPGRRRTAATTGSRCSGTSCRSRRHRSPGSAPACRPRWTR